MQKRGFHARSRTPSTAAAWRSRRARRSPSSIRRPARKLRSLPLSSADDLNAAVAAAKAAAVSWGATPPMKRVRPMFKFKELLEKNADEIARAISREHGKTHADALGELARGIDVVDFACGIPHLLKGEFSRNVGPISTAGRTASRSASSPASRRSTSRPWCRCGCFRSPSPAATPSS